MFLRTDIVLGSIENSFSSLDTGGVILQISNPFVSSTFSLHTQFDLKNKYQVVTR